MPGQRHLIHYKFKQKGTGRYPNRNTAFCHIVGLNRLTAARERGKAVKQLADHGCAQGLKKSLRRMIRFSNPMKDDSLNQPVNSHRKDT